MCVCLRLSSSSFSSPPSLRRRFPRGLRRRQEDRPRAGGSPRASVDSGARQFCWARRPRNGRENCRARALAQAGGPLAVDAPAGRARRHRSEGRAEKDAGATFVLVFERRPNLTRLSMCAKGAASSRGSMAQFKSVLNNGRALLGQNRSWRDDRRRSIFRISQLWRRGAAAAIVVAGATVAMESRADPHAVTPSGLPQQIAPTYPEPSLPAFQYPQSGFLIDTGAVAGATDLRRTARRRQRSRETAAVYRERRSR